MGRYLTRALGRMGFGALILLGSQASAQALADAQDIAGKRLFLRCASCHALNANAPGRIGPALQGVVGRKAGSLAGAKYSAAMLATDFVWTDAMLDKWLTKPNSVVPGTAMAFAGIPNPQDRQALIAYLKKAGR